MNDELIDLKEAGRRLGGICTKGVRRLADQLGGILKVGKRSMVSANGVHEFIERLKTQGGFSR